MSFVVAPVTIAYFTPAEFGYMSLVRTVASLCSIVGLLAVADQGVARFFIDAKDDAEKTGYVATSFLVSGTGVFCITFIILVGTPFVPFFFKDVEVPIIFTALIALLCLTQSLRHAGSNMLKWTFQSPLFTRIALVQTFLGAAVTIGGIVIFGWRAREVLLVGALTALGAGTWAIVAVRHYVKLSAVSKNKFKELAAYSWPLLGLNVFAFFTRSLDRIFLAALASLAEVGIFSVSSAVAGVFQTALSGFFFAWGPYVLSTFRETWAPQRYAQFFSVISWFGIISIIGLGLWGSPVVMLFRPDGAYHKIGIFIPWIASGTLLYYLGGYFAPGPTITKKTYWKLFAFLLAATSNAVLNYILIPVLGILGAGIATTTSSLMAGIFNQIVSNRLFFLANRWKFSFALIVLFTAAISFIQNEMFPYNIIGIPFVTRVFFTVIFICVATLPFYRDIKASGIINQITKMISKQVY